MGKEGGLGNTGALENLPWEGQQWDGPRGASHPGARVLGFCVSDGGRSVSRRSSYVFKGKALKPMLGRRVQLHSEQSHNGLAFFMVLIFSYFHSFGGDFMERA